jgi:hypothetical protein
VCCEVALLNVGLWPLSLLMNFVVSSVSTQIPGLCLDTRRHTKTLKIKPSGIIDKRLKWIPVTFSIPVECKANECLTDVELQTTWSSQRRSIEIKTQLVRNYLITWLLYDNANYVFWPSLHSSILVNQCTIVSVYTCCRLRPGTKFVILADVE